MKIRRYEYIFEIVKATSPKSIVEIGIAKGSSAEKIGRLTSNATYTGYDVFNSQDEEFHKLVGNGKKVSSESIIRARISNLYKEVNLIKGLTQETLWGNNVVADLVFIDGDHRVEAIQGDFNALKNSSIVIFDDYYANEEGTSGFTRDKFGCNKVVESLNNVIITDETVKFPEIRLAIYIKDNILFSKVKSIL